MVSTLSQWQNLKHTIEDPSIATAEYEGRKIGIQLFDQAQEMEAQAILPKIVKWLESIIADTYYNFTMPSKKDREESGGVYSWSHTQRLDYNFFSGMRSEIVGMVKDSKRARLPVPENCRGGFNHLVVSSDVQKSVPVPVLAPAPQTQRLVDDQKRSIPPVFGGIGVRRPSSQQSTTVGATMSESEGKQREGFRQSLTHVPHSQRSATTTQLESSSTGVTVILGRIGEVPATQGIETNSSSQPVSGNPSGEIQVQGPSSVAAVRSRGPFASSTAEALYSQQKNPDWVKVWHQANEKDKARTPYTSSPYPNQQFLEHCPFAEPPPEQQKDNSTTKGADDKWMEEFVDLSGATPPAREQVRNANMANMNSPPERPMFPIEKIPDVPRREIIVPERRGSDSTATTEMGDVIFSDAGASTPPDEDMDEVDMISTDDMRKTGSTGEWDGGIFYAVKQHDGE